MTTKTIKAILAKVDSATTEEGIRLWAEAYGLTTDTPALEGSVHVNYRTAEGCERCKTDPYVPHYNCLYGGKATGHSAAHCTANACY